jgi:hypothetical protein
LSRQTVRAIIRYLLWGLGVIVLAAVLVYFMVVPSILTRQYLSRVEKSADNLSVIYKKLARSATSEPVFNNPDLSTATKQKNLDSIKALMTQTRRQLADFSSTANDLHPPPKVGPFPGGYNKALATQKAAMNNVSQTKDVLNETTGLIDYMATYLVLRDKLSGQLNEFNAISDFNPQIGNSNHFRAAADTIRAYAALLQQAQPPIDMLQFHRQALQTFAQAANGFDDVAASLASGLDNRIYPAVAGLEQVTTQNDNLDTDLFFNTVANSPTLVDLGNITDKLDQFQMLTTPARRL